MFQLTCPNCEVKFKAVDGTQQKSQIGIRESTVIIECPSCKYREEIINTTGYPK